MMSDLELNLSPEVKSVFNPDVTPSVLPNESTVVSIDSPKNIVSEWSPEHITPPHIPRLLPLNTTFFVKDEDDEESHTSSDTPTAIVFDAEQKIRDSIKGIQFKEMLLSRDRQSREIILRRCIEWLQLPTSRGNSKTLDWFMAISRLKTRDSLEESYLWHTLHDNIYASESFKNVISLFSPFYLTPLHK